MLVQAIRGLMEFLWPPRSTCLLCDGASTASPIALVCSGCFSSMAFPPRTARCVGCNRPKLDPKSEYCSECERGSEFGRAWALGFHTGALREAIHHLKFSGREELGEPLGRCLGAQITDPFDVAIPVPLHRTRLRERGYNQAALIAQGAASHLGIPMWAGALVRTRSTGHQAKLDRSNRLQNLQGAFEPATGRTPWAGKAVLVVDDVLTTGTTASALCSVLLRTGASRVGLAVLAVSTTPVGSNSMEAPGFEKIPINK